MEPVPAAVQGATLGACTRGGVERRRGDHRRQVARRRADPGLSDRRMKWGARGQVVVMPLLKRETRKVWREGVQLR